MTDEEHREPDGAARVRVIVEVRLPRTMPRNEALEDAKGWAWPEFEVDTDFRPVPVRPTDDVARQMAAREQVVLVRGTVEEARIPTLERRPGVVRVWRDTPIAPFGHPGTTNPALELVPETAFGTCPIPPCDCEPESPKGTIGDVAAFLGVERIWAAGFRGQGVVIGIVDAGITAVGRTEDGTIPNVVDGFPSDWGTRAEAGGHGNMTATDALGMAPDTLIHDIRILEPDVEFLSAALDGYQWAIEHHEVDGTPHILSNSWGIYQESWDPEYATNPDHYFTRKVIEALDSGILVLFAAGNCGDACPSNQCGEDIGPGRDIWGANGHPRVMTVGAATIDGQLVGYSSVGPAALDGLKPDFCSITHFTGFFESDTGTSAACPVAAGVVALLEGALPWVDQDRAKEALSFTARDMGPLGWDQFSGWGIIQANEAFNFMTNLTLMLLA